MTRVNELIDSEQRRRRQKQQQQQQQVKSLLPTMRDADRVAQRHAEMAEVNWPDDGSNSKQTNEKWQTQRDQKQRPITTNSSRRINIERQIGAISMQMPSMITKRRALECLSRGNETSPPDRLLVDFGCRGLSHSSGRSSRGPLARRRGFGGGGGGNASRNLATTFAAGLLYQIVIVSLILHKFPALSEPTRVTIAEAKANPGSSSGMQTLGLLSDSTSKRHGGSSSNIGSRTGDAMNSGANQRERRQGNQIEMSPIYTNELSVNGDDEIDRRPPTRQRQHSASEPRRQPRQQQQQHQLLKLTAHQTKDSTTTAITATATTTTGLGSTYDSDRRGGENNAHNQSWALSFIESETVAAGKLGGSMRSGALEWARQQPLVTTGQPYKRSRRHAGSDGGRPTGDRLDGGKDDESEIPLKDAVKLSNGLAPDCRKLASLWLYLHSSYPMLASHLIELGMGARESQLTRSIDHLLGDAERLLVSVASGFRLGHRPQPPAWLARVSSHPAYGKLVQHLRAKQLVDKFSHHNQRPLNDSLQNSHRHRLAQLEARPKSIVSSSANGQGATGAVSVLSSGDVPAGVSDVIGADEDNDQMGQTEAAPNREAYGRIVHYPHEIGSTDNSNGMARTRDKLRLLKHQHQQQATRSDGNIVELNKIPPSRPTSETERRRLAESVINQARNNFVYGKVMLQPYGAGNDEELDGNSNRQSPTTTFNHNKPISTLRELAYERERQRMAQLNGRQLPQASQLGILSSKTAGNDQSPRVSPQRSYGHILTSPPNDNRGLGDGSSSSNNNNNNNYHDNTDKSEQARHHSEGADELANQQSVGWAAVEGDDSEEFEGEFHSSPLKQAEVRMLRSLDQQPDEQEPHAIQVTSGELLSNPVKLNPGAAAEIVID